MISFLFRIVPVSFDQPDNAQRAKGLGLASAVPFKKVTAKRLAAELSTLLGSQEYNDAAQSVAAELTYTDGAACAAEALIDCAKEQNSV